MLVGGETVTTTFGFAVGDGDDSQIDIGSLLDSDLTSRKSRLARRELAILIDPQFGELFGVQHHLQDPFEESFVEHGALLLVRPGEISSER